MLKKTFTALDNIITQAYNALDLIIFSQQVLKRCVHGQQKGGLHTPCCRRNSRILATNSYAQKLCRMMILFALVVGMGLAKAGKLRVEGRSM